MDPTEDLMAALEGEEVTEPVADADAATIDRVTEWVAQVNKLNAREAEYVEAHRAAVAKLDERLRERVGGIDYQRAPLIDALETYHRARLAQDPEVKTIHTPAGKVNMTTAKKMLGDSADRISDGVVIVDGEAVPGLKVTEATDADRTFKVVGE